jgi:hypothetical protein
MFQTVGNNEPAVSESKQCRAGRVLYVVDPRPAQYSVILDQLARQGVRIRTCASAADVLRLPATPETTCVVNEQLPELPGVQLCERLRASGARVILTGNYRNPENTPVRQDSAEIPYVGKLLLPLWLAQCLVL